MGILCGSSPAGVGSSWAAPCNGLGGTIASWLRRWAGILRFFTLSFTYLYILYIITYLKSRSYQATELCQFSEAMAAYEKGLALDPERGVLGVGFTFNPPQTAYDMPEGACEVVN